MYIQHPYKYSGKYYTKIDGKIIEISREVALAMQSDYQKKIYRSRKWSPDSENKEYPGRKKKVTEILDCAFSANNETLSLQDAKDETSASPEEVYIRKERDAILHEKINHLTEEEQFIIQSLYFENRSQVEIAEILGMSASGFHHKVNRILTKMKKMLENDDFFS